MKLIAAVILVFCSNLVCKAQGFWNFLPPLDYVSPRMTDFIVGHNDDLILYGTGFKDTIEWKQGLTLAKFDSSGNVLKQFVLLDSLGDKLVIDEYFGRIIKTADGGYVATAAPVQRRDWLLIKFDADLNVTSIREFSDTTLQSNFWYNIRETENGYILYGNIQEINSFRVVGFVKQIDKYGNLIWEKRYSFAPEDTVLSDLQILNDSTMVFVTNEIVSLQPGLGRGGIYKIDFSGNLIASLQTSTEPWDIGYMVKAMPLENGDVIAYALAHRGYYFSTQLVQPALTRFDANFNVIWSYSFGKITSLNAKHLQRFERTADGNFVGAGRYTVKNGNDISRAHGWVYKFSPEGDSIWARTFPTPLFPDMFPNGGSLYGVGVLSSGNIVAGGYAEDGSRNYAWLVKLTNEGCMDTLFCESSAVGEPGGDAPEVSDQIRCYPNPAQDEVKIEMDKNRNGLVRIVDQYGKIIGTRAIQASESLLTLDTSAYPSGLYVASLYFEDATLYTVKFFVQH